MKGCLIGLAVVVGLIALALAFAVPKLMNASHSATSFAKESVAEILEDDSLGALYERASVATRAQMSDNRRAQLSRFVQTNFGPFVRMKEPMACPTISMGTRTGEGKYRKASCQGIAIFEKSEGTVSMDLVTENEEWRIANFDIQSVLSDDPISTDASD